jgi:hypothetical protein
VNTVVLHTCPRCTQPLESGFAHRAAGLSFVALEKLQKFMFLDEDLAQAGLQKLLPSPAAFFRSYLCRGCELYIIDYSQTLNRHEAEAEARSLIPEK